jgi:NAD(P)-dependent dehydrogenase (short-subunit alcohol dehydrogenase family)
MEEGRVGLHGKVAMVTGATSGLGWAVAEGLARRGAEVVLAVRNRSKAESAAAAMVEASCNPEIHYLLADLSSTSEIRSLCRRFRERFDRLDLLVNNAGAVFFRRRTTEDGLEKTFALNHLGYYTLTCLLIDVLFDSAPARIVNVASESHRDSELDFEDLQMRRGYGPLKAYGRSKLANVLFTCELARHLQGAGVTANAVHPGFLRTEIAANNGRIGRAVSRVMKLFAKPVAEGADAVLSLAADPQWGDVSGAYFIGRTRARSSQASHDEEDARRLWRVSASLTGVKCALPEQDGP